jgi:hypothetical protein
VSTSARGPSFGRHRHRPGHEPLRMTRSSRRASMPSTTHRGPPQGDALVDAYELLYYGRGYSVEDNSPKKLELLSSCTHGVFNVRTTEGTIHCLSWGGKGLQLDNFLTTDPSRDFAVAYTSRVTQSSYAYVGFVLRGQTGLPQPVKLQDIWQWAVHFAETTTFKASNYRLGMCVCMYVV